MRRFRIPHVTNSGLDLRDYQHKLKGDTFEAWRDGAQDVCLVSGTGSGKTRTTMSVVHEFSNAGIPSVVAAHRQELVGQLSMALAAEGVYHNIIAARPTINWISNKHVSKFGRSYFHPDARTVAASSGTLVRRNLGSAANEIGLFVCDEGHHLLRENTWGKCRAKFPNALGLGPTATPDRSDGQGLGRHADGFFDTLVFGPPMRELIRQGFLSDYRVFCPPSDMDLSNVKITDSGDYSPSQLKAASRKSHIVGDVVEHYLRIAQGKRGMTFVVSVEDAVEVAAAYNAAGVPAVALSADNTTSERTKALEAFERGELLQLVNCDLFGEGTDCPATEVVTMARPTQSYSLYIQIFGRALRPSPGKTHAIVIDHVGNVERFIQKGRGLPDTPQQWSLDRRERGARTVQPADVMQLTTCLECFAAYDSHLSACPWCGATPVVGEGRRSGPERVDGELYEMDPGLMAQLRGEADRILAPDYPEQVRLDMLAKHAPSVGVHTAVKRAGMQQAAQSELRGRMARWMSVWERAGLPVADVRGMFKQVFGVDYLTAQTLPAKGAEELAGRLDASLREYGA